MQIITNNESKYLMFTAIHSASDVFKCVLMASGFTFDPDNHDGFSDVSASELATGNGYTNGGITLLGVTITKDDTENITKLTCNDISWTAQGGSIVTRGGIVYNFTRGDKLILGYIDLEGDVTTPDGLQFQINDISIKVI